MGRERRRSWEYIHFYDTSELSGPKEMGLKGPFGANRTLPVLLRVASTRRARGNVRARLVPLECSSRAAQSRPTFSVVTEMILSTWRSCWVPHLGQRTITLPLLPSLSLSPIALILSPHLQRQVETVRMTDIKETPASKLSGIMLPIAFYESH